MSESPSLRPLEDDLSVLGTDSILRVVGPGLFTGLVVQSNAFEDYPEGTAAEWGLGGPCASVNLRSIWEEEGADVSALLKGWHPDSGIVEIQVLALRGLRNSVGDAIPQGVMRDARPGRPWHAVIFRLDGAGRRSKPMKRALAEASTWFREPP